MELIDKIDDLGKPAWIALMVLGFIVFWPIGLGLLAYLIWSGRMGCKGKGYGGRWGRDMSRLAGGRWSKDWHGGPGHAMRSSGNQAFDEYREEMLKRLEEEQKEFSNYLERLRMAKDKAEFEQFMNERRARGSASDDVRGGSVPESGTGKD